MSGTTYPGSLDTTTNLPAISASDTEDQSGKEHDVVHTNVNAAVLALETKLGTDNSADNTSVDAMLRHVKNKQRVILCQGGALL